MWVVLISVSLGLAGHVHAQNASAEALFNDGARLMKEGKVAEACEAFEGSNAEARDRIRQERRYRAAAGVPDGLGSRREPRHRSRAHARWRAARSRVVEPRDPGRRWHLRDRGQGTRSRSLADNREDRDVGWPRERRSAAVQGAREAGAGAGGRRACRRCGRAANGVLVAPARGRGRSCRTRGRERGRRDRARRVVDRSRSRCPRPVPRSISLRSGGHRRFARALGTRSAPMSRSPPRPPRRSPRARCGGGRERRARIASRSSRPPTGARER